MKRLLPRDKRRDSKRLSCIILLLVLLGGVARVEAQRPMNDTIIGRDSNYLYYNYNWPTDTVHPTVIQPLQYTVCHVALNWAFLHCPSTRDYLHHEYGHDAAAIRQHTWVVPMGRWISGREIQVDSNEPVRVIGVAAVAMLDSSFQINKPPYGYFDYSMYPMDAGEPFMEDATIAGRVTEYLQLYDVSDTVPQLVEEGPWRYEDTHRYMFLMRRPAPPPDQNLDSLFYERVFEVYFGHDKGVVFDTNFVVAGTCYNNDRNLKGLFETIVVR